MTCEQVREQLPDYLVRTVNQLTKAEIDDHLGNCLWCREEAAMWERLGALPEQQPSPALRSRFDAMLSAYREGLQHAEALRRPRWSLTGWLESWWPHQPAFQFGISVACLAVGLLVGILLIPGGDKNQQMAQLRKEVHNTRQLVALSLLQQQSASERLRGVNYSVRVEQPDEEVLSALLETLKHDPSVDVRLAAVDALRRYAREPMVRKGLTEALTARQSPLVQIALIDMVVELHHRDAAATLRELQQDKGVNEIVRQRAARALKQL